MARTCRSPGAEIARGAHPSSWFVSAFVAGLVALPTPARAMHLAEGTLPAGWAAAWWAVAAAGLALALRHLRERTTRDALARPLTGTMAALIFVLSSLPIPVPIAGSSGHACGTGLAAILIGPWLTLLASFVSLLLQALVEGHGGVTTLGANAVSMGMAGAFAGALVFRALRRFGVSLPAAAAAAGLLADVATYGATTLQLAVAHHGEHALAGAVAAIGTAFLPVQLPIAVLEAALAAGALRLLAARRPALLERLGVLRPSLEER
jgi:cobalt/nickel transport system permease protein